MNRIEKICLDTTNRYIYNIIREQREDSLIEKAKKYTDYQVDGLPCVYRYNYLPQNDKAKPTQQEEQVQNLVWCFKHDSDDYSDEEYQRAKQHVCNYVKRVLTDCFGTDLKHLCLVCVPCHSAEANTRRWKELSNDMCKQLSMTNGFDHIKYNTDADHPSHWGGHTYPNVTFDKKFFKGKIVVLLDDLIPSGQSLVKTRNNLEEAEASVVLAITIAKTRRNEE